MTVSNFNCSFSDLGDAYRLGCFEYEQYQSRFAAHKPSKYTAKYGEDNLAQLKDFLNMDEYAVHTQVIQAARDNFVNEIKGVSSLFKTLKNYTTELTPDKAKQSNLFKDAGQQLFDDRSATNLADNDKLLSAMIRFVQVNQAALLAKDLPATFVQQLKDKQTSLVATNAKWLAEKDLGTAASDAKTGAGNDLKARLSAMFAEAQTIFQDEKEIAKKFVWETTLVKVRGVRDAGLNGKTVNKAIEKSTGIGDITVFIASLNLSVVSGADGRYDLSPIPAGVHDIEATGVGFKKFKLEKRVIKAGVMGRLIIEMEPEDNTSTPKN